MQNLKRFLNSALLVICFLSFTNKETARADDWGVIPALGTHAKEALVSVSNDGQMGRNAEPLIASLQDRPGEISSPVGPNRSPAIVVAGNEKPQREIRTSDRYKLFKLALANLMPGRNSSQRAISNDPVDASTPGPKVAAAPAATVAPAAIDLGAGIVPVNYTPGR